MTVTLGRAALGVPGVLGVGLVAVAVATAVVLPVAIALNARLLLSRCALNDADMSIDCAETAVANMQVAQSPAILPPFFMRNLPFSFTSSTKTIYCQSAKNRDSAD